MLKLFFLYLLAAANLISIIHIGLYVVGANTYDIRTFKKQRDARRRGIKKQPYQPLLSVVIPAHNESQVITRTLDSVLGSSYENIEVLVVDDGSTDNTNQVVRDYVKKLRRANKLRLRTYFSDKGYFTSKERHFVTVKRSQCRVKLIRQANMGKAAAMNHAIADHVRGRYVMCLDADSIIHPKAIERAVIYLKKPQYIGVAANVRIIGNQTLLGKVQRFEHMVGYRSKKFYSMANCEFIIGGVGSTYRTSILRKVKFYDGDTMTEDIGLSLKIVAQRGNKQHRIFYAADVVAYTEGVQFFKDLLKQRYRWKMGNLQNLFKYKSLIGHYEPSRYSRALTLYRLPMAIFSEIELIIEPLLLGYIIYLSISYHTLGILIGAYVTITIYTMTVLWADEHLETKDKLKLSSQALWIYILFYTMDVVQTFAVFKSLKKYKNIIHRENVTSTWVSPSSAKQIPSL
jgi:cellulose synthase/poly-beta-1,6-N-acetylglucosamine synthase-like glycosyltransferase